MGPEKHALYAVLTEAQPTALSTSAVPFAENLKGYLAQFGQSPNPEPEVLWNFEKFLVSKDGEVVKRFSPDTDPFNPALITAIEAELAA